MRSVPRVGPAGGRPLPAIGLLTGLDGGLSEIHHFVSKTVTHLGVDRTSSLAELGKLFRRKWIVLHAALDETLQRSLVLAFGDRPLDCDRGEHCVTHRLLLIWLQGLEGGLVHQKAGPIVEMRGVRNILLNLEELANQHVVVGVLLPVDDSLLQSRIQLPDVDRGRVRSDSPECEIPGVSRWSTNFQTLKVFNLLDRPFIVRNMAGADLAPAQKQNSLFGYLVFDIATEITFDLADGLVGRRRCEGKRHRTKLRHELIVETQTTPRHLDLTGAQLVDLLKSSTQRVAGKQINLNGILRKSRDFGFKSLHGDRCRMGSSK